MDVLTSRNTKEQAFDIQIHGLVQGVGFRPTVWNLARRYGIRGRVFNNGKGVQIFLAGKEEDVQLFIADLTRNSPPLAKVTAVLPRPIPLSDVHEDSFIIADSD
ncbi:MAG: acylphosphatase, partial [Nitrospirales bacterium]|nr:acylphosphatase [Nitrospirales bacterium]